MNISGSSPRLRGTRGGWSCVLGVLGIIPALAGNTALCCLRRSVFWDHPRACGEHKDCGSRRRMGQGSSPRLRGTLADGVLLHAPHGIIPALAGNTSMRDMIPSSGRDHPRACGEHGVHDHIGADLLGSSPRLRGTLLQCCCLPFTPGIIPALAGNTLTGCQLFRVRRDHPRACGEHTMKSQ